MILAGDLGGTKTKLALVSKQEGRWRIEAMRSYPSQQYPGLEAIMADYLSATQCPVDRACIGIPGPVVAGEATAVNLNWHIVEESVKRKLGLPHMRLANDLEILAYAVPELGPADLVTIHPGAAQRGGAIAILAPGTGLGQAYLSWDGERYHPGSSEGGHADFAPHGERERQLHAFLEAQFGHVSWERVLSGPGLHNIYRFLASKCVQPEWVAQRLAEGDPSAAISALALAKSDQCCMDALEMFVSIFGAQAGNLALTFLATGGVYLGGGIPPKILPRLQDGTFVRAFLGKGRLRSVVQEIPVHVITNEHAQIIGAAACALAS